MSGLAAQGSAKANVQVLVRSATAERFEMFPIGSQVVVGRHTSCQLRLESDTVSRQHAVLELTPDGLRVEDVSTNGTMAGETLLRREAAVVPYGTPISLGEFVLFARMTDRPATSGQVVPSGNPGGISGDGGPWGGPSATTNIAPMGGGGGGGGERPTAPPVQPLGGPQPLAAAPAQFPSGFPQPPTQNAFVVMPAGSGAPAPAAGPLPAPLPAPRPPTGAVVTMREANAPVYAPPPAYVAPPQAAARGPAPVAHAPQQSSSVPLPPVGAPPRTGAHPLPTGSAAVMQRQALTGEALERRKRDVELRRRIHKVLLEHLDLATMDPSKLDDPSIRPRVLGALRRIVGSIDPNVAPDLDRDTLIGELADEALGLGPLERFLSDPAVSEIMVVDPETIYIERGGRLVLSDARFTDDDRVRAVIERIVTPLGRRIDESSPIVDARLKDGSRVNAIIKPLALRGSCITIRKFARTPLTLERLIELGTLTPPVARFLTRSVIAKKNIIISGGTGSGKTTLLNVLSGAIPSHERIVTIEDAAELQLKQPHVVSLETRPPNLEGRGEYTIRDLVKNALRMRPDRIVVGECRGGEALDMLQAMNTGHDGSLTTTHANTPQEAASRLETLALMSGLDLPSRAIREQISASIHLIVQQSRLSDGTRKITAVSEVIGMDDEGAVELRPIFEFVRTGTGPNGQVVGDFRATGYLPSYLSDFIVMGLVAPGESYL
ncbi:MAG: Flp pilus assembly complex ATPase component TadA [Myxococcales bacterium]|nr:Flp pilus assembly complex ATPase component TadA [Myxococcales bacterium]